MRISAKVVLFTVLASIFLSGCALFTSVAKVANATAAIPDCRIALNDWATLDTKKIINADLVVLDATFDALLEATTKRPDISYIDAVEAIVGAPDKADELAAHYTNIETAATAQGNVPDQIKECNTNIKRGWSAMRDSKAAGSAQDALRAWGPMALQGLKLLPLILKKDQSGPTKLAVN